MNTSGIHPKGPRLLILPEQIDSKSAGGIIKFTATQQAREELAQIEGVVIEIGASAWLDKSGAQLYGEPLWASIGDTVLFAKYSGFMVVGDDGKQYRLLNDLDIIATKERSEANG